MWTDTLRLIHEQQIYDPHYGLLDMNINLHFGLYVRDILKDHVDFKDKKIILKGRETSPLYLMYWFLVVLLKELLEEYVNYEKVLRKLSDKQDHLSDKQDACTRDMSEITFVRKNTDFTKNFTKNKERMKEIDVNFKLLRGFIDLIKERLNTKEKVEGLVSTVNLINEFETVSNIEKLKIVEVIEKGCE